MCRSFGLLRRRRSTSSRGAGNRPKMKRKRYYLTNRPVRLECVTERTGEGDQKSSRQTDGTVHGHSVREKRHEFRV